ncbi:MAG: AMP-binding protein [Elusimicrobiales bacterium]|nr:AMP-binding protein [Elusimicrobiales bacterium]
MKIHNTYLFGKASDKAAWTPEELEELGRRAQAARALMRGASREYIVSTLARAGALFEKGGRYRKAALAHLKGHITFSPPVIDKSLDVIPELLGKHAMNKRLNMELFLPYALEAPVERRGYDGLVRAAPKGVVLHVGAGNVFLGILDSLVIGFLTKNVNIVKLSSSGSNFINLFMEALKEVDEKGILSKCAAVVSWKGGSQDLEEAALKHVNAVFVWGGYDAVQAYRRIAPIDVRVEGFGPKTSVGVVFASCVDNEGMAEVARRAALDASLWDQAACSSLHTLYLIAPAARHKALAAEFLKAARPHFARLAAELPPGKLSPDEQVEITRARELARVDAALGAAAYESSAPGTAWTVIYEKDPVYRVSPLNRVLYVKTVESIEAVRDLLMPLRGYIQTVGVGGSIERKKVLETLAPAGIARVVKLGKMLEEANGSPHDGIFPMMSLVNWLPIEEKPSQLDRLSELVDHARSRSPFYGRHFKGVPRITALADFEKVPFLEKHHVLENTPPDSADLLTSKVQRGIFFASGGSTGQPKYVFYDQHEYDHTCRMLAYTLEAAGLGGGDVIANLFIAGNLWSSWLSVEKAIAYTKAISVPVGSNLPLENIAGYLEDFKVTAVIGLPSFLVKLAEYVKADPRRHKLCVKKIFYGGEYVGEEMVKFFKSVFPGVDVRSAGYATADAGVIGFQCPACVKGQHHLFAHSQFIEFVDQDTLKPVKPGEVGELVVTGLSKKHMPIIRYRVGDLGRWLLKPCACKRKEPLFEILGRCDDRIHVGGAHLFVNDIQNALGKVPDLSFNFQVVIGKKGHKDTLAIRVEVKDPAALARSGELADLLWRQVEEHCEDLHESVRMKWLDKPAIDVLKPNTIERIQRTGKIRKVIDKRVEV